MAETSKKTDKTKTVGPLIAAEERLVPVLGHTFSFIVTYSLVIQLVAMSTNASLILMVSVMSALTAVVAVEHYLKSTVANTHDIGQLLLDVVMWSSTFMITTGSMFLANLFAHVLANILTGVDPIWSAFFFTYGLALFYSALLSQG